MSEQGFIHLLFYQIKESKRAIEDTQNCRNLISYQNINDFCKQLGLIWLGKKAYVL